MCEFETAELDVALEAFEFGGYGGGALEAKIGIFLHHAEDDFFEARGDGGVKSARRFGIGVEDGIEEERRSVAAERALGGDHFVKDFAEGKDVAAGVEEGTARLFGRHV